MDMTPQTLQLKLHYPDMPSPAKAHCCDSGLDLTLMKVIEKRDRIFFFDTGISIEPPEGYYTELYPRSSIFKTDFIMTNSVGIIDTSYRGIIYMPMRYVGSGNAMEEAQKLVGQRVGQLLLKQIISFETEVVTELSETKRGKGGFGSTGA